MILPEQVDNAALAVKERRELDAAEKAELEQATSWELELWSWVELGGVGVGVNS